MFFKLFRIIFKILQKLCSWLIFKPKKRKYLSGQYPDDQVKHGDAYLDRFLPSIFEEGNYDPCYLDDININFKVKAGFIDIDLEPMLHDSYIMGLKTLHRQDHGALLQEGGRVCVKALLGAGVLHYSGVLGLMKYFPSLHLKGVISYMEINIVFSFDATTRFDGVIHTFEIVDFRGIHANVSGLGPLNFIVNIIIKPVLNIFENSARSFLEESILYYITDTASNYLFPIYGDIVKRDNLRSKDPNENGETIEIKLTKLVNQSSKRKKKEKDFNIFKSGKLR